MMRRDRLARQIQSTTVRNQRLQSELWTLTRCFPHIHPDRLAHAVERTAGADERPDFRTRLLIRDSLAALERHWGRSRFARWLSASPVCRRMESIRREDLGEVGFPSLEARLMPDTDPEMVKMFLRDLGERLEAPIRLEVGRCMALILAGYLSRGTEDIDVVDEVPAEVRQLKPRVLGQLAKRYGLKLTHFQSYYLPREWKKRLHYLDEFGRLRVYLVNVYDVFLSKLFSGREKDRDDLIVLARQLKKDVLVNRLRADAAELCAEAPLRRHAERNWVILYNGEPLPAGS